jgi:NADP-dependent 3-hydroxy acid dehydrogenase YdfG
VSTAPTLAPSLRPVAVITGASTGIGAATARRLAASHDLVLTARRADALARVADGTGGVAIVADMTRRGDVERVVAETLTRFGRLDVWINNVGQGITRLPSELTDEDLDVMLRVNVRTALYGMQATLPHFRSVSTGHVINLSSMLGRLPTALPRAAYSAAKHFLNALTANFRTEVQGTHPAIQYSLVSPGVVHTDFGLNAVHGGVDSRALPDAQSAEEIAEVIARVVVDRRPDVYTRPGSAVRIAAAYAALGEDP